MFSVRSCTQSQHENFVGFKIGTDRARKQKCWGVNFNGFVSLPKEMGSQPTRRTPPKDNDTFETETASVKDQRSGPKRRTRHSNIAIESGHRDFAKDETGKTSLVSNKFCPSYYFVLLERCFVPWDRERRINANATRK